MEGGGEDRGEGEDGDEEEIAVGDVTASPPSDLTHAAAHYHDYDMSNNAITSALDALSRGEALAVIRKSHMQCEPSKTCGFFRLHT